MERRLIDLFRPLTFRDSTTYRHSIKDGLDGVNWQQMANIITDNWKKLKFNWHVRFVLRLTDTVSSQ